MSGWHFSVIVEKSCCTLSLRVFSDKTQRRGFFASSWSLVKQGYFKVFLDVTYWYIVVYCYLGRHLYVGCTSVRAQTTQSQNSTQYSCWYSSISAPKWFPRVKTPVSLSKVVHICYSCRWLHCIDEYFDHFYISKIQSVVYSLALWSTDFQIYFPYSRLGLTSRQWCGVGKMTLTTICPYVLHIGLWIPDLIHWLGNGVCGFAHGTTLCAGAMPQMY